MMFMFRPPVFVIVYCLFWSCAVFRFFMCGLQVAVRLEDRKVTSGYLVAQLQVFISQV